MDKLKTIDIKGKPYVEVNERIKAFRKNYEGWSMETEIISLNDQKCVMKAVIRDREGQIRATGTAYEMANSSYINKTSYIENCETSAWGRALGCLGIGIDTSIASYEEVAAAMRNQQAMPKATPKETTPRKISESAVKTLNGLMTERKKANKDKTVKFYDDLLKEYGVDGLPNLTEDQYIEVIDKITNWWPES